MPPACKMRMQGFLSWDRAVSKDQGVAMAREQDPAGASIIGLITGFQTSSSSRTGLQVSMLVRGAEQTFDAVRAAYDLQFSDDYFPYPPIGERIFRAVTNDDRIVTELIDVNDFLAEGNPVRTALMLGTYKMFEVKITEETPRIGAILMVEEDTVTFTDFNRYVSAAAVAHCSYGGAMPAPADGVSFKLAPDANVYTWDWTTDLAPLSRCSREEARAKRFPTRAYCGSLADIAKNCYWAGFYSTRGDEDECDLVKCFLNAPPGWE